MQLLLDQQFCNLDAVQGSALADLVAAAPQAQAVGVGQVGTDTANEDQILAGGLQRHGILLVSQVIHQLNAGSVLQNLAGFLYGNRAVKLSFTEMEWLRMTGTRTQVQETFISGRCMILRPSKCSFISSLV